MRAGTTQDARQQRMYHNWTELCSNLLGNPDLLDSSLPRIKILQVYEHRVQHAHYSKQRLGRIGKESVSQAWGGIASTHLLDGLPDPRNPPNAQAYTSLDRRLGHQLKTYGVEDPLSSVRRPSQSAL